MSDVVMNVTEALAWDGDVAKAREVQRRLAARLRIRDEAPPCHWIAGVDVGFEQAGAVTRAAAILLDAASLLPVHQVVMRRATRMPYIPGLLSFRELPAVLDALAALPRRPDLVFVDGQGIAHPRRLGIAGHLGAITDLPTIGVAKSILVGRHEPVGELRGDRADLVDHGERIGVVLRSKTRVRPLIVSPGHRVSIDTAVERVLACCRGYRLPEPTRRPIAWLRGETTPARMRTAPACSERGAARPVRRARGRGRKNLPARWEPCMPTRYNPRSIRCKGR